MLQTRCPGAVDRRFGGANGPQRGVSRWDHAEAGTEAAV